MIFCQQYKPIAPSLGDDINVPRLSDIQHNSYHQPSVCAVDENIETVAAEEYYDVCGSGIAFVAGVNVVAVDSMVAFGNGAFAVVSVVSVDKYR